MLLSGDPMSTSGRRMGPIRRFLVAFLHPPKPSTPSPVLAGAHPLAFLAPQHRTLQGVGSRVCRHTLNMLILDRISVFISSAFKIFVELTAVRFLPLNRVRASVDLFSLLNIIARLGLKYSLLTLLIECRKRNFNRDKISAQ